MSAESGAHQSGHISEIVHRRQKNLTHVLHCLDILQGNYSKYKQFLHHFEQRFALRKYWLSYKDNEHQIEKDLLVLMTEIRERKSPLPLFQILNNLKNHRKCR